MPQAVPPHTATHPNPCHSALHSGLRQTQSYAPETENSLRQGDRHPRGQVVWTKVWEVVRGSPGPCHSMPGRLY